MTVNFAIGMFTPPFGLNIFVSTSIFQVPATRATVGSLPFVAVYIAGPLLTTYIPALSLWLPSLLY